MISDYAAVMELLEHGVAEDEAEAAAKALAATLDIEMTTNYFRRCLPGLIAEDTAKARMVDNAVRRILTAKYKLGIMDDPYRFCGRRRSPPGSLPRRARAQSRGTCSALGRFAEKQRRSAAAEGRNGGGDRPFADSTDLCGCWSFSTRRQETVTLAQGLRARGWGFSPNRAAGWKRRCPAALSAPGRLPAGPTWWCWPWARAA